MKWKEWNRFLKRNPVRNHLDHQLIQCMNFASWSELSQVKSSQAKRLFEPQQQQKTTSYNRAHSFSSLLSLYSLSILPTVRVGRKHASKSVLHNGTKCIHANGSAVPDSFAPSFSLIIRSDVYGSQKDKWMKNDKNNRKTIEISKR